MTISEARAIAYRLSKSGYGDPVTILNWDAEMVLGALDYEMFICDYGDAFQEANKGKR